MHAFLFHHIHESYTFKMVRFWPTLYYISRLVSCVGIRHTQTQGSMHVPKNVKWDRGTRGNYRLSYLQWTCPKCVEILAIRTLSAIFAHGLTVSVTAQKCCITVNMMQLIYIYIIKFVYTEHQQFITCIRSYFITYYAWQFSSIQESVLINQ